MTAPTPLCLELTPIETGRAVCLAYYSDHGSYWVELLDGKLREVAFVGWVYELDGDHWKRSFELSEAAIRRARTRKLEQGRLVLPRHTYPGRDIAAPQADEWTAKIWAHDGTVNPEIFLHDLLEIAAGDMYHDDLEQFFGSMLSRHLQPVADRRGLTGHQTVELMAQFDNFLGFIELYRSAPTRPWPEDITPARPPGTIKVTRRPGRVNPRLK